MVGASRLSLRRQLAYDTISASPFVQNLENRGLVTKHPAVVAQPRNNNFFSNHVQTNVIHLTRFAPNVGRATRLMVGGGWRVLGVVCLHFRAR